MIGNIYKSERFGEYQVIEEVPNKARYYKIRFLNTGSESIARADHIKNGQVKDYVQPTMFGVGYAKRGSANHPLYTRWANMLSRCYNENNPNFNAYGRIGVRVCDRWHCFENFIEDVVLLPGYELYLNNPDIYQLDKDYLQQNIPHNRRIYSKETCMWISKYDNLYMQSIGQDKHISPDACQYVGVFRKGPNSYNAKIKVNGKNIYLGTFSDPVAAANAYNWFYNYYNRTNMANAINKVPYMDPTEFIKYNNRPKKMLRIIDKVQRLSPEGPCDSATGVGLK